MAIRYGLAELDRYTGSIDWNIHLPMDGVQCGTIYEFLQSAGENGWELCGSFPSGTKGNKRALPNTSELRQCEDVAEQIAFIFKKVD